MITTSATCVTDVAEAACIDKKIKNIYYFIEIQCVCEIHIDVKSGTKNKMLDAETFTTEEMLLIDNGADVGPMLELLRELTQILK